MTNRVITIASLLLLSATGVAQDGTNFGAPLTSTRHMRQLPSMPMSG